MTKKERQLSVCYVFGTRANREFPGAWNPFIFTIRVPETEKPASWQEALARFEQHHDEFVRACVAADLSSPLCSVIGSEAWIPGSSFTRPTIEVSGKELTLAGQKPNPWLSRRRKLVRQKGDSRR